MLLKNIVRPEANSEQKSTASVLKCAGVDKFNNSEESIVSDNYENANSEVAKMSFPIPNGLAMDPLAQTALAVPTDFMDRIGSGLSLLRDHGKKVQKYVWRNKRFDIVNKTKKSIVNVVLVEAKDLPEYPTDGSNTLYCKFKLGTESHKTKQVSMNKLRWSEQFKMNLFEDSSLELTVWHKGKQKNFMGRSTIDLSLLEKEKTHDLWQPLECGNGSIHLLVTLNPAARAAPVDNVLTNCVHHVQPQEDNFIWYRLHDWSSVGQLQVTVRSAKGLSPSLPSLSAVVRGDFTTTYAVLQLDNSRLQTPHAAPPDPIWDKNFILDVSDVTSNLLVSIYAVTALNPQGEFMGQVSIPLLRINNNEDKWYALKDRNNKSNAKGNCPRILLRMSLVWNPIKASVRVLSPKEVKYTQEKPKFNIPLIYSNLKFIKDIFQAIQIGNEEFKQLFEWDSREKSFLALTAWLCFWYLCQMWMLPLLLVLPFVYNVVMVPTHQIVTKPSLLDFRLVIPNPDDSDEEQEKNDKTIRMRLMSLQELTFTIKNGIDYIVSLIERIKNLVKFVVPYLSYLAIFALVAVAVAIYLIPINYLFMAFGIYKFTRKVLHPDRVPNNDILDFLSRVPDNEMLKQWKELKIPEPSVSILNRSSSVKMRVTGS